MRDSMLKGKCTYPFMVRPLRCAPRAACIDKSEQSFFKMLRCMIKLGSLSSDTQSETALFYLSSRCMNWCALIKRREDSEKTVKQHFHFGWFSSASAIGKLQPRTCGHCGTYHLLKPWAVSQRFWSILACPQNRKKWPSSKTLVTSKSEKLPWQVSKGMLREAVSCFAGNISSVDISKPSAWKVMLTQTSSTSSWMLLRPW